MTRKTNIHTKDFDGVNINPQIEVGEFKGYSSGSLLDANAVVALIDQKIANVVGGATTAADTLKELEDKINQLAMSQITNDANYVQQDQDGNLVVNETNITNTISVISNQPFPESWPKNDPEESESAAFSDLITAIEGDDEAIAGKVYLATVHYTDLPADMHDAELKIEITGERNSHKIAVFSITSANVSPYNWHATMWNGELTDWRSYALVEEEPGL